MADLLPHLRGTARAVLGPGADAEDATQAAALKILKHLSEFRGDGSFLGWARRVATRVAVDALRGRRFTAPTGADDLVAPDPGETNLRETLARPVSWYLDRLSPPQREALVLRHVLEFTTPEAAELLGLSPETVKSRVAAGRAALRKLIAQDRLVREATAVSRRAGGER